MLDDAWDLQVVWKKLLDQVPAVVGLYFRQVKAWNVHQAIKKKTLAEKRIFVAEDPDAERRVLDDADATDDNVLRRGHQSMHFAPCIDVLRHKDTHFVAIKVEARQRWQRQWSSKRCCQV